MVEVWHEYSSCTAVAFRLRCTLEEARNGVVLTAAMVAYDDGRTVIDDDGAGTTGSLIVCQACGLPVETQIRRDRLFAITAGLVRRVPRD